jgi:hypothetical protein
MQSDNLGVEKANLAVQSNNRASSQVVPRIRILGPRCIRWFLSPAFGLYQVSGDIIDCRDTDAGLLLTGRAYAGRRDGASLNELLKRLGAAAAVVYRAAKAERLD